MDEWTNGWMDVCMMHRGGREEKEILQWVNKGLEKCGGDVGMTRRHCGWCPDFPAVTRAGKVVHHPPCRHCIPMAPLHTRRVTSMHIVSMYLSCVWVAV